MPGVGGYYASGRRVPDPYSATITSCSNSCAIGQPDDRKNASLQTGSAIVEDMLPGTCIPCLYLVTPKLAHDKAGAIGRPGNCADFVPCIMHKDGTTHVRAITWMRNIPALPICQFIGH